VTAAAPPFRTGSQSIPTSRTVSAGPGPGSDGSPVLLRDPRVRGVPWRDLLPTTRWEVARELLLGLPWLAGSLYLAWEGLLVPALACSFFLFVAGIRQAHGGMHYSLGLPRAATEWAMFGLSLTLLGSMHAVQVTHLRHHARSLEEDDDEGFTARMGALGSILAGPLFTARIMTGAMRRGTRAQRRWIVAELAATVAICGVAVFARPLPLLEYHVAAMAIGHCLTGFFLVWLVHHDCDRYREVARTLRGLKALPFMHMMFHLEHHLFPAVPTVHLPELARRLDEAAPELREQEAF